MLCAARVSFIGDGLVFSVTVAAVVAVKAVVVVAVALTVAVAVGMTALVVMREAEAAVAVGVMPQQKL
jgi:hypothetical protein